MEWRHCNATQRHTPRNVREALQCDVIERRRLLRRRRRWLLGTRLGVRAEPGPGPTAPRGPTRWYKAAGGGPARFSAAVKGWGGRWSHLRCRAEALHLPRSPRRAMVSHGQKKTDSSPCGHFPAPWLMQCCVMFTAAPLGFMAADCQRPPGLSASFPASLPLPWLTAWGPGTTVLWRRISSFLSFWWWCCFPTLLKHRVTHVESCHF